ncbi:MAG: hypothetical protein QG604_377 [Candidatus Dependentiae bacterium]|nr:hypothetical protein [Candidatus Dependentiae bacterium]
MNFQITPLIIACMITLNLCASERAYRDLNITEEIIPHIATAPTMQVTITSADGLHQRTATYALIDIESITHGFHLVSTTPEDTSIPPLLWLCGKNAYIQDRLRYQPTKDYGTPDTFIEPPAELGQKPLYKTKVYTVKELGDEQTSAFCGQTMSIEVPYLKTKRDYASIFDVFKQKDGHDTEEQTVLLHDEKGNILLELGESYSFEKLKETFKEYATPLYRAQENGDAATLETEPCAYLLRTHSLEDPNTEITVLIEPGPSEYDRNHTRIRKVVVGKHTDSPRARQCGRDSDGTILITEESSPDKLVVVPEPLGTKPSEYPSCFVKIKKDYNTHYYVPATLNMAGSQLEVSLADQIFTVQKTEMKLSPNITYQGLGDQKKQPEVILANGNHGKLPFELITTAKRGALVNGKLAIKIAGTADIALIDPTTHHITIYTDGSHTPTQRPFLEVAPNTSVEPIGNYYSPLHIGALIVAIGTGTVAGILTKKKCTTLRALAEKIAALKITKKEYPAARHQRRWLKQERRTERLARTILGVTTAASIIAALALLGTKSYYKKNLSLNDVLLTHPKKPSLTA